MSKNTFTVSSEDSLLTTPEVAAILRLTPESVRALPIERMAFGYRSLRFKKSDVDAFLKNSVQRVVAS